MIRRKIQLTDRTVPSNHLLELVSVTLEQQVDLGNIYTLILGVYFIFAQRSRLLSFSLHQPRGVVAWEISLFSECTSVNLAF